MSQQESRATAHKMRYGNSDLGEQGRERHIERLKKIVGSYGWPSPSLVGEKASREAFLMLLKADDEKEFQLHCLELLKKIHKNDASPLVKECLDKLVVHLHM